MNNVLFDLDGTLTDPHEGIANSILYSLDRLGVNPPEDLKWCIGPPLQDSFAKMLEGTEHSNEKAVRLYRDYFSEKGLYENQLYAGINDCLESLRSAGKKLFVATSKPHVYARKIIEHFRLTPHFVEVHGSELDGTRKDKGDLIQYILEVQGIDPADCLMVGDRKHDLIGAHLNKVISVGVSWGYGDIEELEAENPKKVCANPEELKEWILGAI